MLFKNSLLEALPLFPEPPTRPWLGLTSQSCQRWLSLLSLVVRGPEWVLGTTRGLGADSGHHGFGVVGLVMGSSEIRLWLTPLLGPG